MKPANPRILTLNGGSSSIKFALYETGNPMVRKLHGTVDRIGGSEMHLTFSDLNGNQQGTFGFAAANHKSPVDSLIDWLEGEHGAASVEAVGHRVVHGMKHIEPELVTPKLLDELHRIRLFAPDHLPREIELIEAFRQDLLRAAQ